MLKVLKWLAIGIGSLILLVVLLGTALFFRGRSKAEKAPQIATVTVPPVVADSASIERGRHIVTAIAPCAMCHGAGLKGEKFPIPAPIVDMAAPNLTRGRGGVGDNTPEQWHRAIRGGVGRNGRQLIIMPSANYATMSESDFASVVADLGTVTPVDNELPPRKLGPAGAIMSGAGIFPLGADMVAKTKPQPSTVQPAVTAEYGAYLIGLGTCRECHGADLEGAPGHGTVPAPSLRTNARTWTEEQFRSTIRTGRTPEGRVLNSTDMPWPYFSNMTDDELKSIWLYIHGLPPAETKS
jgi:cytochrome c553